MALHGAVRTALVPEAVDLILHSHLPNPQLPNGATSSQYASLLRGKNLSKISSAASSNGNIRPLEFNSSRLHWLPFMG